MWNPSFARLSRRLGRVVVKIHLWRARRPLAPGSPTLRLWCRLPAVCRGGRRCRQSAASRRRLAPFYGADPTRLDRPELGAEDAAHLPACFRLLKSLEPIRPARAWLSFFVSEVLQKRKIGMKYPKSLFGHDSTAETRPLGRTRGRACKTRIRTRSRSREGLKDPAARDDAI